MVEINLKPRIRVKAGSVKSTMSASRDPYLQTGALGGTPDFGRVGGRRGPEIQGLHTGPTMTNIASAAVARQRSRFAVLTNPHAKRAVDVLVSNVVGSGHRLVSLAPDPELKRQIEDLWNEWVVVADSQEQFDFYGLQALAFRSMIEGGECFARMRMRRPEDGLSVPMQIQLIEAEQCPIHMNERRGMNSVISGIEINPISRPVAFHLYQEHPGDFGFFFHNPSIETVRVDARDILHLHEVRRPNSMRGLPWLSQVLVALTDIDRYLDAELTRKKAAALISGILTQPFDAEPDENPFMTGASAVRQNEVEIEDMEPGTLTVVPAGWDVKFLTPTDVGANFDKFMRQQLLSVCAALNITYEQLTGDLKEANDRTIRASMLEFKRMARAYQRNILVHQFCRRVFDRFIEVALISGRLALPSGVTIAQAKKARWMPDPWEYLNPTQEITAKKDQMRAGLISRTQAIIERGDDPEDIDNQIAADREREKRLGLVFDTDAGSVSRSGTVHHQSPLELEDEEDSNDA